MKEGPKQLRVLGHPAHAPLTHFPLALWTAGFLGNLLYAWRPDLFWWHFAFWNTALGLALGSLTLGTGFYDYAFIPGEKTQVQETAIRHMMAMLTAACCFGAALYFNRGEGPADSTQKILALSCSGLGALLLHCGGWLGGQLVYHFGVGREPE